MMMTLSADPAPAAAVGNVAELLRVDVQHRTGMVMLVAADGFSGGAVDARKPVEMGIREDAVDRRRRDAEPASQLHRPFPTSQWQRLRSAR